MFDNARFDSQEVMSVFVHLLFTALCYVAANFHGSVFFRFNSYNFDMQFKERFEGFEAITDELLVGSPKRSGSG